ncbi:hypothetical protein DL89DRAFT_297056 [Linderina pennispora]|uniref:Aminotransferase class I/classII large domain-containing protein n=1 Tax=Linderina pennispora TaxID=61395 RepID=A0A1Y1VU30_9FUNG|nr:uncharacterized protein DL89DRAFT_297056 [Linderina pennispora]ORX64693.1 hypothetical protein DL89DRAFT_297056 [Linderina pennispora]
MRSTLRHYTLELVIWRDIVELDFDHIIADFLADHAFVDNLISTSRKNLAENYALTTEFFDKQCGLPIAASTKAHRALGALQATEVAKLWTKETDLTAWEHIVLNERVYFPTGQAFCSTEPGWFRFTFAITKEQLVLALDRIGNSFKLD